MQGLDPDLRALQEVRDQVAAARAACDAIATWDQARTDRMCAAVAAGAAKAAHDLARLAVEETGIGRVHYKVLKNLFGSEGTWASIRDEKTVGVISRDEQRGLVEVATPAGVIAGIVPTTNPTSTAMNNALISLKGRNAIVISPHPRAKRCIGETVEVMRRALERDGAPPDLVCALSNPTIESTGALMKHRDVALILATGGSGLVNAAYSSGKPAYGVGPGNVPVYVDRSADVAAAARWITSSQSFDNATLCCSEQGLILDRPIADAMLAELVRRGAHLCNERETELLARLCNRGGHMNPDVVGQDPCKVAQLAGFEVPRSTTILLAHQGGVGREWPLSIEILCPLLSVHLVDGWKEGCALSKQTLHAGGLGHTLGVWAKDRNVLEAWFLEKPANRIVVNGPTSEGAVGYSTNLDPAMSLGCGPQAGNITSDNISARHLVNVKRVAFAARDWESRYERDHARAAALSGERAPRGSGLDGDPALGKGGGAAVRPTAPPASAPRPARASSGEAEEPRSNWRGNAPTFTGTGTGTGTVRARAGTRAGSGSGRPSGTGTGRGTGTGAGAGVARGALAVATGSGSARSAGPHVGYALSPSEIEGILAHAGAGCPLGPCKGCPHMEVRTGACTA